MNAKQATPRLGRGLAALFGDMPTRNEGGTRVVLPQAEDCVLLGVASEINERSAREAAVRLSLAASAPEGVQNTNTSVNARSCCVSNSTCARSFRLLLVHVSLTATISSAQENNTCNSTNSK